MYPEFQVPGVPADQVWQLFNVSNFPYYCQKVKDLQNGICPFCQIDPEKNHVLFENASWLVWENKVAPRGGQELQLIIPSKRHIRTIDEMDLVEWSRLGCAIEWIKNKFNIPGGVLLVRSGDPLRNAKSVDHLHFNYHVPTGVDRVEVTIAKSADDLAKKLPVLQVFEKLRLGATFESLSDEEKTLVEGKLEPKK